MADSALFYTQLTAVGGWPAIEVVDVGTGKVRKTTILPWRCDMGEDEAGPPEEPAEDFAEP